MPRSRSFTRFTMRVGLEHLGQSVLLLVSIAFLRSPVLAIFAILFPSPVADLLVFAHVSAAAGAFHFREWPVHHSLPGGMNRGRRAAARIFSQFTRLEAAGARSRDRKSTRLNS